MVGHVMHVMRLMCDAPVCMGVFIYIYYLLLIIIIIRKKGLGSRKHVKRGGSRALPVSATI